LIPDEFSPSEGGTFGAHIWKQAFALSELPRGLFSPANALTLLPHSFLGRLFIGSSPLDFTEEPFALELLFQDPEGLIDVVVANENFQSETPLGAWLLSLKEPGSQSNYSLAGTYCDPRQFSKGRPIFIFI
jgi:hypothetical protein